MRISSLTVLVAGLLAATFSAHAECRLEPGPQRTVTRALDGETLQLDDGSEVRLAGALAPRAYDAATSDGDWPAASTATAALAALTVGRNVVLGTTGTAKRDRQNRHVAHVFVVEDGKETWVQGRMLADGHARAYQMHDQRGCLDELLAHEQVARLAKLGIWNLDAYRVRPAHRTRDLDGMTHRFAILTGRIAWVAPGRSVIALGFTPVVRRGYTLRRGVIVMIENRDRELLGSLGGDAQALQGRNVEVRGWLEQRLGRPAGTWIMDISLSGIMTFTDPPADAPATAEPAPVAKAEPSAVQTISP